MSNLIWGESEAAVRRGELTGVCADGWAPGGRRFSAQIQRGFLVALSLYPFLFWLL